MKALSLAKSVYLLPLFFMLLLVFSCSNPVEPDNATGEYWDSMAGTTWYILTGSKDAMERWKFYRDSVVVDIDHFSPGGNTFLDSMEAHYRERHIGKVCTKDAEIEYWINSEARIFRCTELQWKRYTPSMGTWTPVYSWSVYQMWCIEYVLEGLACIGDAPNCFEFSRVPLVQIKYPEGWAYDTM